ncbi:MAG: hypothetical protein WD873_03465 [Candidatus Hydrogenedentales bacterium]
MMWAPQRPRLYFGESAMDETDLRDALLHEVEDKLATPEERRDNLIAEAARIRERFPRTTDEDEKRSLQARYREIDKELDLLKRVMHPDRQGEMYDRDSSGRARAVFNQAKYDARVAKGLKRVQEKHAMGMGENAFGRIKSELNYLLSNYTSANDAKIEQLIDKWRRSGDPSYDPSINVRYRSVRKKKMRDNHAL